jgi:hypothetical protein
MQYAKLMVDTIPFVESRVSIISISKKQQNILVTRNEEHRDAKIARIWISSDEIIVVPVPVATYSTI